MAAETQRRRGKTEKDSSLRLYVSAANLASLPLQSHPMTEETCHGQ